MMIYVDVDVDATGAVVDVEASDDGDACSYVQDHDNVDHADESHYGEGDGDVEDDGYAVEVVDVDADVYDDKDPVAFQDDDDCLC